MGNKIVYTTAAVACGWAVTYVLLHLHVIAHCLMDQPTNRPTDRVANSETIYLINNHNQFVPSLTCLRCLIERCHSRYLYLRSEVEIEATLPPVESKEEGLAFSAEKHDIISSEEIGNVTLPPSDLTEEDGVGFLKENRSYTIKPEEVSVLAKSERRRSQITANSIYRI